MQIKGIIRYIDSAGRVGIPMEIRREMNVTDRTPLEISTDESGEHIILTKRIEPELPADPLAELCARISAGEYDGRAEEAVRKLRELADKLAARERGAGA